MDQIKIDWEEARIMVLYIAWKFFKDKYMVEEVTQQTLIHLYEKVGTFDPELDGMFSSFIFKTARNKIIDIIRVEKTWEKHHSLINKPSDNQPEDVIQFTGIGPMSEPIDNSCYESIALKDELEYYIAQLKPLLSETELRIFEIGVEYETFSPKELEEITGIRSETIGNHKSKIKSKAKALILQ